MKKWTYGMLLIALFCGIPTMTGHSQEAKKDAAQKPEPKKIKELMRRKLESSQELLKALTIGDLDIAGSHAEKLLRLSKEEEWKFRNTRQYEMWSDDFRQNAEAIVKAAKEKNLQGARLNYLGMTLDCFNCHSYVREQ